MATKKIVTIKGNDGEKFNISFESAALLSSPLKKMLEEGGDDVTIPDIDSKTLAMVVAYLHTYGQSEDVLSDDQRRDLYISFVRDSEFRFLKSLFVAGYYLEITGINETVGQIMADIISTKSLSWHRKAFDLEDVYTPEEKAELRRMYAFVDWKLEDERERKEAEEGEEEVKDQMTLEEYQKLLEEKRKAVKALNTEGMKINELLEAAQDEMSNVKLAPSTEDCTLIRSSI